jgi:DNA-binding Lrp family transcriptional regulator
MSNHLINKTLQLMTVKQIAAALNVSAELVKKRIRELFPDKMVNGKTTYLTESEVTAVKLRIQENSSLQTYDDRNRLSSMPKTELEKKMIIQQAMFLINEEVETLKQENNMLQLENKDLQIELDEEKSWYSVKRIKSMGYLQDVGARQVWSPLKKWSIDNDYQIKTIFDANYGSIKTYHKDAWSAVYKIDFAADV